MLTYQLKKGQGLPLYESLYRCIREDILRGTLQPGEKLPSKRALCANLKVSKITVENAYNQLLAEGYIRSQEKVGYFVEALPVQPRQPRLTPDPPLEKPQLVDLTANGPARFPFSVWSRLQRQVLLDTDKDLLQKLPNQGLWELRQAIARHLQAYRGMDVDPQDILIGAGTDFLYNLLVQLLGRDKCYALEEPGYGKIRRIYESAGARCLDAPMDQEGVLPQGLADAHVLHISPAHHFPTGRVTSLARRHALLSWAWEAPDRWIIEDDYDSEFRFQGHPLPTLRSLDRQDRVIYMNSFSKSLAPSIRVGFMVLPAALRQRFLEEFGFYGCTVTGFEQHTLTRFMDSGHFERHINRMRKFYRTRRDLVAALFEECPCRARFTILEEHAGLHFLLQIRTNLPDEALVRRFRNTGILVRSLGSYYHGPVPAQDAHCLVVNYSGLTGENLQQLREALAQLDLTERSDPHDP